MLPAKWVLCCTVLSLGLCAAQGTIGWAVKAGGSSLDYGYAVASDGLGGYCVTGNFQGTATFGSTTLTSSYSTSQGHVFAAHMTSAGVYDWAVQATGSSSTGKGIAPDGLGGCVVAGDFHVGTATFGTTALTSSGSNDVFVMHVTSTGAIEWATKAGGSNGDYGNAIAPDGSGGYFVAGRFQDTATFGTTTYTSSGNSDVFVMHVTSAGAISWATRSESPTYSSGEGLGITRDGSGGCFITGEFGGTVTFGTTTITSSGPSTDAFVMRVTSAGAIEWAIKAGGSSGDRGYGITPDGSGGCHVTGSFKNTATFGTTTLTSSGSYNPFVMHVTSAGVIDWAIKVGGLDSSNDRGVAIAADGSGGSFVTGRFSGTATFGNATLTNSGSYDVFVMHVTSAGLIIWAEKVGGLGWDRPFGIAADGSGGCVVIGAFYGTATFGTTNLTSSGSFDVFVVNLRPSVPNAVAPPPTPSTAAPPSPPLYLNFVLSNMPLPPVVTTQNVAMQIVASAAVYAARHPLASIMLTRAKVTKASSRAPHAVHARAGTASRSP